MTDPLPASAKVTLPAAPDQSPSSAGTPPQAETSPENPRAVIVLNGPNLGRLGSREPEIYGSVSHDELVKLCAGWGEQLGLAVDVRQTDDEAELISWLQAAADAGTPVVLNPAAFTHYSYALRDAAADLHARGVPLIEVHLTNPATREGFRHASVIAATATGTIAGFGPTSYHLALTAIATGQ